MAKFKVLLVDDEEELVSTLVERLGYRDIHADYALDGYDAMLKMRDTDFDVVVLDLKLPGMSGVEVLKKINAEYPGVPVLMITGHGTSHDQDHQKPAGAAAYLVKPVDINTLIARMEEAVARHE